MPAHPSRFSIGVYTTAKQPDPASAKIHPFIVSGKFITLGLQEFGCFPFTCRSAHCPELRHASEKSPQSARRRLSSERISCVHSFSHPAGETFRSQTVYKFSAR